MSNLRHILLVDDSSQDIELALAALAEYRSATDIVTLRDGTEALDYLFHRGDFAGRSEVKPDVILLDLKMPKVDGMEVLRQVKNTACLKTIPVVMMTSSREEQDLAECYRLGVNAYFVKPVNFHPYMEAVKSVAAFWAVLNEPPPASLSANPAEADTPPALGSTGLPRYRQH